MFAHGVMTALFFAMVGAIYDQAHTRDMRLFSGLVQQDAAVRRSSSASPGWRRSACPGSPASSPSSTSSSARSETYPWAGALGIFAAAMTAVYILRMMAMAFFGPVNEQWAELKEMTYLERGDRRCCCSSFMLFMGLWPAPFIDRISETVRVLPGVS